MLIFAHRGASTYAPENTMSAFKLAFEQSADGIELDIHITADGEVVVTHDENLSRTSNGTGYIMSKTFAELREMDFGSWFSPEFTGEKIPTLDEVLEFIIQTNMILNIEIKTAPIFYSPALIRKVYEKIQRYNLWERIIVSSFDHQALIDIKELDSNIKTGILYSGNFINIVSYAKKVNAQYLHPQHEFVTDDLVEGCMINEIGINAWTVNEKSDILRLNSLAINSIILNHPDIAIALTR